MSPRCKGTQLGASTALLPSVVFLVLLTCRSVGWITGERYRRSDPAGPFLARAQALGRVLLPEADLRFSSVLHRGYLPRSRRSIRQWVMDGSDFAEAHRAHIAFDADTGLLVQFSKEASPSGQDPSVRGAQEALRVARDWMRRMSRVESMPRWQGAALDHRQGSTWYVSFTSEQRVATLGIDGYSGDVIMLLLKDRSP
jgi:hypothetical protein